MSDEIRLSKESAMAVFDIAVNSMDFGSGFLDNEEVDALREFAVLIGVDPMNATPVGFRTQYVHDYTPVTKYVRPPAPPRLTEREWLEYWENTPKAIAVSLCRWCDGQEDAHTFGGGR